MTDNRVTWNHQFNFVCKMTAAKATGVLDACPFRISIRQETKGGTAVDKVRVWSRERRERGSRLMVDPAAGFSGH